MGSRGSNFPFPLDTSHAAGVENGKGIGDIEMAILRRVGEGAELGQSL